MDNIKFYGGVVFCVAIAYLFLTILMPFFTGITADTAATINASPYAANYVAARAGVNYVPLALYLVPGAIGVFLIVLKLKKPDVIRQVSRIPRYLAGKDY